MRRLLVVALACSLLGPAAHGASAATSFLGPYAWSSAMEVDRRVDQYNQPGPSIACPSPSLCVMVDRLGMLVTSNEPDERRSWFREKLASGSCFYCTFLDHVSCPSVTLCVVLADDGTVYASRRPDTGARSWESAKVSSAGFGALICTSNAFCAIGDGSQILFSSDPGGGSWSPVTADPEPCPAAYANAWPCGQPPAIGTIACPTTSFCVAGDAYGRILASDDPTAGSSWHEVYFDPGVQSGSMASLSKVGIHRVVCQSTGGCLATTTDGRLFRSLDPLASGSWKPVPGRRVLLTVACPSPRRCVGVGGGTLQLSDGPFPASSFVGYPQPLAATDISCPDEQTCVAASSDGAVSIGHAPTYAGSDLRNLLRAELVPDLSLRVATPVPGDLAVAWYRDGHLVAWGGHSFRVPGKRLLTLHLTPLGTSLRDRHRGRAVTARAVLTVPGHAPIQAGRRLRPSWGASR